MNKITQIDLVWAKISVGTVLELSFVH